MTKGCIFSQNNQQHETGRISASNIGVHWVWVEFLTKCQPTLHFCIISISKLSFIFYGQKWAWIYKLVLFWPKLRLAEHKMCRLMCQSGPLFCHEARSQLNIKCHIHCQFHHDEAGIFWCFVYFQSVRPLVCIHNSYQRTKQAAFTNYFDWVKPRWERCDNAKVLSSQAPNFNKLSFKTRFLNL